MASLSFKADDENDGRASRRFLTIAEAATQLGVQEAVVRRLAEAGQLDGANKIHADGQWLIPSESLVGLEARSAADSSAGTGDSWLVRRWKPLAAVLAAVSLLAGGVAAFDQLATRAESLLPEGPPFAPAAVDETVIVITAFEDMADRADVDAEIGEELERQVDVLGLDRVRVEYLDEKIDRTDRAGRVDELGEELGASIVVWGVRNDVTVITRFRVLEETPVPFENRIERCRTATGSCVESQAAASVQNPPSEVGFITGSLPNQLGFIVLYLVAATEHLEGNTAEAARLLAEGIDLGAAHTSDTSALVDAYFTLGYYQQILDRDQQATAAYGRAIKLDPANAAAFNNRGVAHDDLGELERAIADYDRAIELDPEDAAAFNNRGNAYRNLGELELAIVDYDRAIELTESGQTAFPIDVDETRRRRDELAELSP